MAGTAKSSSTEQIWMLDLVGLEANSIILSAHLEASTESTMPESSTSRTTKPKRVRTQFKQSQLDKMEEVFSRTQYPDVTVLETLANDMDLAIEKVCTWFQNRRSKFRKESKKNHIAWMREQFTGGKSSCDVVSHVIPVSPEVASEVSSSSPSPPLRDFSYNQTIQQPSFSPSLPYPPMQSQLESRSDCLYSNYPALSLPSYEDLYSHPYPMYNWYNSYNLPAYSQVPARETPSQFYSRPYHDYSFLASS